MVNQSEVSLNEYSQVDPLNSDNYIKGEKSVAKDAEFWLPKITREHFTWLSDDFGQQNVIIKQQNEIMQKPLNCDCILTSKLELYIFWPLNICIFQKQVFCG